MTRGALDVRPGDIVAGKYRIERRLGAGGMGVVFAARQLDLDRPVALKVLAQRSLHDSPARARFLREARAAAALDSEHAVRVLDTGTLEDGTPFIAMERLEGCDLGEAVKALGPFSIAEATSCVVQACRALAEAHARGIVHRDVKPSNLFVARRYDGTERVVVLDFGISKSVFAPTGVDLTATFEMMGSPKYMSPEQVRSSKYVDARTDVWALGVVLYYLLAGVPPFVAPSLTALAAMIVEATPIALSSVRADVPPELEAIVMRCLEKRPESRLADVRELATALAPFAEPAELHIVGRVPIAAAAPPEEPESTRAPVSRETAPTRREEPPRARWKLAAAGGVVGAATFALAMWARPPTRPSKTNLPPYPPVPEASVFATPPCVELSRRTHRRGALSGGQSMASGIEHGMLVEWGMSPATAEVESAMLPLTMEKGASATAELTPLLPSIFPNARSVRAVTTTLGGNIVVGASFREGDAHGKDDDSVTSERWVALGPTTTGEHLLPLGARTVEHRTRELAMASADATLTMISIGRPRGKRARSTLSEVLVANVLGPGAEHVVFESPKSELQPLRVLGTAARTRPIVAMSGAAGITAFAIDDGNVGAPMSITAMAPEFTRAVSRQDEAIVAWIDRASGALRYRCMPEHATAFDPERDVASANVTSLGLAALGSSVGIAWAQRDERGGRHVHVGRSDIDLEDAVKRAHEVDVDGEVLDMALSKTGFWLAYGGGLTISLATFVCAR